MPSSMDTICGVMSLLFLKKKEEKNPGDSAAKTMEIYTGPKILAVSIVHPMTTHK